MLPAAPVASAFASLRLHGKTSPMPLPRRRFLRQTSAAVGVAAGLPAVRSATKSTSPPAPRDFTVGEVVDVLLGLVPGELPADTVDTLKRGQRDTPCTGVVVTFMATVPVLEEAARRGANLVVTHEPTFYNHRDQVDALADDPVYAAKRALLERHGIAVFRFHDGYHRLAPDPVFRGFVRAMAWEPYAEAAELDNAVVLPEATPLRALARAMARQLGQPRLEYVGDPEQPCRRIGILPGAWGRERHLAFLGAGDIDVLIVGEAAEWEAVEYARDAQALGLGRALVVVGHAVSEDPGVVDLGELLRPLVPGLNVAHVRAGDPLVRV